MNQMATDSAVLGTDYAGLEALCAHRHSNGQWTTLECEKSVSGCTAHPSSDWFVSRSSDLAVFFEAEALLAVAALVMNLTHRSQRVEVADQHIIAQQRNIVARTRHRPSTICSLTTTTASVSVSVTMAAGVVDCVAVFGRCGCCDGYFGSERARVPLQSDFYRLLPLRLVCDVVVAVLAVALVAVNTGSETLAVELETLAVLTIAAAAAEGRNGRHGQTN